MSDIRAASSISPAMFFIGFLLPVLCGGNVFFLLEPAQAIPVFALAALGLASLLMLTRPAAGPRAVTPAAFLVLFVSWWCGNLFFRTSGVRAPIETQGLLAAALLYGAFTSRSLVDGDARALLCGIVAGALLTTVYAQYQYWFAFPRIAPVIRATGHELIPSVNANFYNANCYGAFLAATILLCSALLAQGNHRTTRGLAVLCLPVLLLTLALTESRSAIAILILVGVWLLAGSRIGAARPREWRLVVGTTVAACLVAILVAGARADLGELWRIGTVGRVDIWRGSLAMIADHWLFGVGPGRFGEFFHQYQVTAYYTRYPHSFLLEVWAEVGIVGAVALSGFLTTSLRRPLSSLAAVPRHASATSRLQTFLAATAVLLVAHAAVDIDWHAPANPILAFVSLALGQSDAVDQQPCFRS